jgi:hypothetical protein
MVLIWVGKYRQGRAEDRKAWKGALAGASLEEADLRGKDGEGRGMEGHNNQTRRPRSC